MTHYLIIGNGAAGLSAAEMIRQQDAVGRITIVTDEPYPLYSRPGIAYLLMDQLSEKQLLTRTEAFYREHRFELCYATVKELDPSRRVVFLDSGKRLNYDVVLLATGASAVRPGFPGADLEGVVTFDTLDDAKRIVRLGRRARTAVIVGGGITAMELAEGVRHQGARTYLLQRRDRIWPRLFNEAESALIERQIKHEGIRIHYQEEIEEVIGKRNKVSKVRLKSGREMKCQLVGVGVGVRPNVALVRETAVTLDRGILVNEYMQSNLPDLFAAGDVAQVYDRWTEQHTLDVLWPSAINEGRTAGCNMVAVAKGTQPNYAYQKGSPFNAALLFGVHMTVIGQINDGAQFDELETISTPLSRGTSQVWTAPFSSNYHSAWDRKGPNSIRIIIARDHIVGALLMGNQELADPIRQLIESGVNIKPYKAQLLAGGEGLSEAIWQACRQS